MTFRVKLYFNIFFTIHQKLKDNNKEIYLILTYNLYCSQFY